MSAIAYMSQPTGGSHPGWGTLGMSAIRLPVPPLTPFLLGGPYEGVPFRPTILGAVRDLGM